MKDKNAVESPFVIDQDSLYIDFETEAGIYEGFSYLTLRRLKFENLGKEKEAITFFFDTDTVRITGMNLNSLYQEIKKHRVSIVRKGISAETTKPQIKEISILKS